MEASARPGKSVKFDGAPLPEKSTETEVATEVPEVQQGAEEYRYDPEEKGETWDIYKQRSVMENISKRKSEDAVLIKAKADAALRAAAVAEAAVSATAENTVASEGRRTRGRTAVVQTQVVDIKEPVAAAQDEEDEDDDDDEDEAQAPAASEKRDGYPAPAKEEPKEDVQSQVPVAESSPTQGESSERPPASDGSARSMYPLAELQAGCPPGVSASSKEDFLSDADFVLAMKMTREEYAKIPKWKQQAAKKAANIF